jgi:hypothetical protein
MGAGSPSTILTPAGPAPDERGVWFGMKNGDRGTHTSRTMMLDELGELLQTCPSPDARADHFRTAIVTDNALGKRTLATRKLTF